MEQPEPNTRKARTLEDILQELDQSQAFPTNQSRLKRISLQNPFFLLPSLKSHTYTSSYLILYVRLLPDTH